MGLLTDPVEKLILSADAKALGTYHDGDINVVPVSSVKIVDGKIRLVNYFMDKTSDYLQKNPNVSLACWKDLLGYQIKGTVEYHTSGPLHEQACEWIAPIHPDREVKGLIVLTPNEIFDVAPDKSTTAAMEQI